MATKKIKDDDKPKIYAYVRVSTDAQDAQKQIDQINEYAARNGLHIPEENVIAVTMSSRKTTHERRIDELQGKLKSGDTLIATEMSRIGRSTREVLEIVETFLVPNKIDFIFIKDNITVRLGKMDPNTKLILSIMSAIYENERNIVSRRTKDALDVLRARGVQLGKPRGLPQHSKLDAHLDKIKELLVGRISKAGIARILECSRTNLGNYLRRRPEIMREVRAIIDAKEKKKAQQREV